MYFVIKCRTTEFQRYKELGLPAYSVPTVNTDLILVKSDTYLSTDDVATFMGRLLSMNTHLSVYGIRPIFEKDANKYFPKDVVENCPVLQGYRPIVDEDIRRCPVI